MLLLLLKRSLCRQRLIAELGVFRYINRVGCDYRHETQMLGNAAAQLSALNTLEASMRSTASVSSTSNIARIACIVAASLQIFVQHIARVSRLPRPHPFWRPSLRTFRKLSQLPLPLLLVRQHLRLYPVELDG